MFIKEDKPVTKGLLIRLEKSDYDRLMALSEKEIRTPSQEMGYMISKYQMFSTIRRYPCRKK